LSKQAIRISSHGCILEAETAVLGISTLLEDFKEIFNLLEESQQVLLANQVSQLSPEQAFRNYYTNLSVPPYDLEFLYDVCNTCENMHLLLLSNGCVGMGYFSDLQADDLVALLFGDHTPMIIRLDGGNYRLIGRAIIGGMPDNIWPMSEDCGDIQLITLV
jgi:hypothetical protein